MTTDSVLDERALREIYLAGYEIAVKEAQPWTVMCSYNRLFGEFASQNDRLLTTILRKEWGYEGVVISDWGATVDRVTGLLAGLDIEMPHVDDAHDREIIQAVESGLLPMDKLDLAAARVTELILKSQSRKSYRYEQAAHHDLARSAAAQSAVLLKNDGRILPVNLQAKCAIIGAFAKNPRYQGTGSSKILPYQLDNTYEELLAAGIDAEYADGYPINSDGIDPVMLDEACRTAKDKEVVFLFAGLPDRYEAEGFDRESMRMPANHVKLIEAVSEVNRNLVVILLGGAPMEIPWVDKARAILLMYLGGQAGGGACADLLLGKVNPSGKLAESWPASLEDNPSYNYFPGYSQTVEYREGLFVGYRFYDSAEKTVRFPFGYGLSYTQFEYNGLIVSKRKLEGNDEIRISCKVKNTGQVPGKEVVQLYIGCQNPKIFRPAQELKGFEKVTLEPGESKEVAFTITTSDLSYFNTHSDRWEIENGNYEVRISSSSRDIRLSKTIEVAGNPTPSRIPLRDSLPGFANLSNGLAISDTEFENLLGRPIPQRERIKGGPHTINSTITDIQDRFIGRMLLKYVQMQINKMSKDNADLKIIAEKMLMDMPLRFLTTMDEGLTNYQVKGLVEMLNGHLIQGLKTFLAK